MNKYGKTPIDFDFLQLLLEFYSERNRYGKKKISRETLLKFYNCCEALEDVIYGSFCNLVSNDDFNSQYAPDAGRQPFKSLIIDQSKNLDESFIKLLDRLKDCEDADGRFYVKDVLNSL